MVYCALAMRIDQFSREKRRKMLLTSEGLIGKRRGYTALNLRNRRMRAFREESLIGTKLWREENSSGWIYSVFLASFG
jgi:hypothetical protein